MADDQSSPPVKLFYAYCHKDGQYKESMEKALALLQSNHLLLQWSDQKVLPGQHISSTVRAQIDQADIIAFLFSPDFIASSECMKEWNYAKDIVPHGKLMFRIPIILRDCSWKDVLTNDDVKALPTDGVPVTLFGDSDVAWQAVYEGIKNVIHELRTTFTPKSEFLDKIENTEFLSQHHIKLQDLFVFLNITTDEPKEVAQSLLETSISSRQELLTTKYALIHGEEKAGKTALARHLYLSLIEESRPVMLIDLAQTGPNPTEGYLRETYQRQFHGDYTLWAQQPNKTLILDNMTAAPRMLDLVTMAKDIFDQIIIMLSSDILYSFFIDESRLAEFRQMKIEPLTRHQQEILIRKRLALSDIGQPVTDGLVDQVEDHVNSVIITEHIVPRYPFYVLAILQTYEAYMPSNMSITSYGYCYYVLIFASLARAGISKSDDAMNACFNFADHLAFETYQHRKQHPEVPFDFQRFLKEYCERFLIATSIINRLKDKTYGIINDEGIFRSDYMYYYFLGRFLASHIEAGTIAIDAMCESSHVDKNYLTLLFTIHHTTDNYIIDEILLRTMCTLESVDPATLNRDETRKFRSILAEMPANILSKRSVEDVRGRERNIQDDIERRQVETTGLVVEPDAMDPVNGIYKILKNNKIMGQILRNKHGNLERSKIEETIEIIADSGLRLVNVVLKDEEEIADLAIVIQTRHPKWNLARIKRDLQFYSFLWTLINVEFIVNTINVPAITEAVNKVVSRKATPAYDLVGYFSQLARAKELTEAERNALQALRKKHKDAFVRHVLSLRTQYYMNTHRSKVMVEQAICGILEIKYAPRVRGSLK